MGFEKLKVTSEELLAFLREKEYSAWTIKEISYEIRNILENADRYGWNSYRDVFRWYESQGRSKNALRHKGRTIRMIERFDIKGEYPDGTRQSRLFENDTYEQLPLEFRALVEFSHQHRISQSVSTSTAYSEASNAIIFFRHMQKCGRSTLDEISEKDVLTFFALDNEDYSRGYAARGRIAVTLRIGMSWKKASCQRILSFLPEIRRSRKIVQYLTEEEITFIREALSNMENGLSYRDRAIGTLLLYTGLRACDIAGLLLESIDWEHDMIRIMQRKTNIPLELPLSAIVGNAIFDYLIKERAVSNNPHIFLTEVDSQRSLRNSSIGNIVIRIFHAANIRTKEGDRKGTHIFRYHAASHMLESGVPLAVISRTLGHTSPSSVNPYLMADFTHLKECALSIEKFPLSEEVLPV